MDTGDHLQCQQPVFPLSNSWGIPWYCWKLQCLDVSLSAFTLSLFLGKHGRMAYLEVTCQFVKSYTM